MRKLDQVTKPIKWSLCWITYFQ